MADAPILHPEESLRKTYPRINEGFSYLYKNRGGKVNFDVDFPLKEEVRDGAISRQHGIVNKALLDIKIINARKGKYYRIEWIGNGTTAWGTPNYDILINEYDAKAYATNSSSNKRNILNLNEGESQTPLTNIFTQNLKSPVDNILVSITIDYSQLGTAKSIPLNTTNDAAYSFIIDPSCYVYTGGVTTVEKNTGVDAPLTFTNDMVDAEGALSILRKGLLDMKVYNAASNKSFCLKYITKNQSTFNDLILIDEVDNITGERRALFPTQKVTYPITNRYGISTIFITAASGETVKLTFDYSTIKDGYVPPTGGTTHPFYTNRLMSEDVYYSGKADVNLKKFILVYNKESNIASVYSKYGKSDDIQYVFRKMTVNQLFALYQMYTKPNANPTPNVFTDGTPICKEQTDWVSPYIIGAVNNGDGTSPTFTGGAHGSDNNNTTGFPTAETMSYQIFIDGKIANVSDRYSGDRIDIYVRNRIMSYNTKSTKRFTHEELVHYTISSEGIDVEVEIIPYEKLLWKTYYGLQAVTNYYTHVIFPLGQYGVEKPSKDVSLDAGLKSQYRVNTIMFSKSGTSETLELWMDNTIGLGKRLLVDNDLPLAFTREYNKAYMRLVGETEVTIDSDDVYTWKGGWRFRKL